MYHKRLLSLILCALFGICLYSQSQVESTNNAENIIYSYFNRYKLINPNHFKKNVDLIDSICIEDKDRNIDIYISKQFYNFHLRPNLFKALNDSIISILPDPFNDYNLKFFIAGLDYNKFIPDFFMDNKDKSKIPLYEENKNSIVSNTNKPYRITKGLQNKHIAIWNSHGIFYDQAYNKWNWQRPRLFSITEDTYTTSIVIPFLLPMLENAGACTFLPRERDTRTEEVIVDGDMQNGSTTNFMSIGKLRWEKNPHGYALKSSKLYSNENPFKDGNYYKINCQKTPKAYYTWIPDIPKDGDYAVYVSYKSFPESAPDAKYMVYHSGDTTTIHVNQKMGGSSWIYIGTYHFKKGKNRNSGRIVLYNYSRERGSVVTADAVKIGGGVGNIVRCTKTIDNDTIQTTVIDSLNGCSNKPRYLEGARYWLQYSGFEDSIYSPNKGANEYKDDLMSRALWVNNLAGGSNRIPNSVGKNIPLDLALAIHTDAGVCDSIIGSLAIYTSNKFDSYPNGQSRLSSRDLADLVQTQTVEDIEKTFNIKWTRRRLLDESYYESRVPEIPTFLFEFLSHQNFNDMKLGLDPKFKFVVARAIYKGVLKYLSNLYDKEFVVQPLPVKCFYSSFSNMADDMVHLSWVDQIDSLEETATPKQYVLYTSVDGNGFDNGITINKNYANVHIDTNRIYRFKVTAINEGGESFPSEILSVAKSGNEQGKVLIVNGFDQVSAPEFVENDSVSGFISDKKYNVGTAYIKDISHVGNQYDFNKNSAFIDNDYPGFGASLSNFEDSIICGNTFDYPYIHGLSILENNYSFASCSSDALENDYISSENFSFIDYIMGDQQTTKHANIINKTLSQRLENYLFNGGNLFISGRNIIEGMDTDSCDIKNKQLLELLHIKQNDSISFISDSTIIILDSITSCKSSFHSYPNSASYFINNPSCLDTESDANYFTYTDTPGVSSSISYSGYYKCVSSSIPFEILKDSVYRRLYMKKIIDFFNNNNKNKLDLQSNNK